jgi:hypothetical protein
LKQSGGTGPALSLPTITLFEQYDSAGPPHQKAHRGDPWFPVGGRACRTIEGFEAMHVIRKGQIRWLPKVAVVGSANSSTLFGIAAIIDIQSVLLNLYLRFYLQHIHLDHR